MDKQKYSIVKKDCIKWMNAQKPMLVDCVITSPPYNLKIKYANYKKKTIVLARETYNEELRILHCKTPNEKQAKMNKNEVQNQSKTSLS